MAKKLFLIPNSVICKSGKCFPGGEHKVTSPKGEFTQLSEKDVEVFKLNLPFLLDSGRVVDLDGKEALESKKDAEDKKKSDARIALEEEAASLEIEFKDRTSNKDLKLLIEAKKEELEKDSE